MPARNGSPAASPRARSSSAGPGVPVVDVEHVERRAVAPERRQRGPAEEREPPRVVGVVVERRRGRRPRARRRAAAGSRPRPRSTIADRRAARPPRGSATASGGLRAPPSAGTGTRAVAGQEHVDGRLRAPCPPRAGGRAPGRARRRRRPGRRSWPRARTRRRAARRASSCARIVRARDRARCDPRRRAGDRARGTGPASDAKPVHNTARCRSIIPPHGTPRPRSRRARRAVPPAAASSRACGGSPTTCGGAGTRGRARCSRASTPARWARYRNPIPVLQGRVDWSQLLDNPDFMAEYEDVLARVRRLHGERRGPLVPAPATATSSTGPIAYFCAEYGFHESLGIYSGGLGVLAGDHMKTAWDMALPFVGVGPPLPPRLLPPDDRRGRPPGARLPGLRPQRACRSCGRWTATASR